MKTPRLCTIRNNNVGSLKCCASSVSSLLCDIFNLSVFYGVYPDQLKIAKIIPVYKKEAKDEVSNYRPISILPAVNKIFETFIQRTMYSFLNSCNFFNKRQYGFREGSGTHTAMFELVSMINKKIDSKKIVSGLFIDLSKAFDTVIHSLLLRKLEYAGVRGVAFDLLKSYLSNRKQYTVCNGESSSMIDVTVGVPQGGVLSPLLFIIFINDFFNLPIKSAPFGFADDTNMFESSALVSTNILHLSNDLIIIAEYFRLNKLTLNLKKTKLVHFRKPHAKLINPPILTFNGITIEVATSVKCLGLTLDEFVSWREHIDNVGKTVSSRIGVIKKLYFLPKKILRLIYFSTIHCHLTYCVGIWGSANKTLIDELHVLHKKSLKATHKLPMRYSSTLLFKVEFPTMLTVRQMYKLAVCKFVYCSINNLKHHSLTFASNFNRYETRYSYLLKRPKIHSDFGKRSLLYAGPTLFNTLPILIRNLTHLPKFIRLLKEFLLKSV